MEIEHQPDRQRWVAQTPEGEAELTYAERDGVLDLQHTFVPRAARDQGVAGALAERAMRYAREHGKRVVPSCPFVRSWLQDHPEHRELVAGS